MSKKLTAPIQVLLAGIMVTGANLALMPPSAFATPTQFEFVSEMMTHRKFVKIVGLYIFNQRLELFSLLSDRLVNDYLDLHDIPKIMPIEAIQKIDSRQTKTIADRLVVFYGKRRENMDTDEYNELIGAVKDLNRIEDVIKEKLFKKLHVTEAQQKELRFLEELSDFAVSELTRQVELPGFNAVEILNSSGKIEVASRLSEILPMIRQYMKARSDCEKWLNGA